jgi:mono/diheme cytochrome c family protein
MQRRDIHTTVILASIAAVVLVGCGSGSGSTATPSSPSAITPPPGATLAMVTEGQGIFNSGSCMLCHGLNGRNPSRGPDLTDSVFLHNSGDFEGIVQVITTGVPRANFKLTTSLPEFEMFPRGGMNLSDAQVRSVAAYAWTLSHSR